MKVLDPGHLYLLTPIDGTTEQLLRFVKRDTPPEDYPGNVGAYCGTNIQDVVRVLIDRFMYLNHQISCEENETNIDLLRKVILNLELRAAKRHGIEFKMQDILPIELQPVCKVCGHIVCEAHNEIH